MQELDKKVLLVVVKQKGLEFLQKQLTYNSSANISVGYLPVLESSNPLYWNQLSSDEKELHMEALKLKSDDKQLTPKTTYNRARWIGDFHSFTTTYDQADLDQLATQQ